MKTALWTVSVSVYLYISSLRKEAEGSLFLWWQPQGRGEPCVSPNNLVHMRLT